LLLGSQVPLEHHRIPFWEYAVPISICWESTGNRTSGQD